MTTIPGASQYLSQAALAISGGSTSATPSVLGGGGAGVLGGTNLLEAGRAALGVEGFGLSSSARAANATFLAQSQSLGNQILSLAAGTDATVEGARLQILALRGSLSETQLAPFLREDIVDTGDTDNAGDIVDIEA